MLFRVILAKKSGDLIIEWGYSIIEGVDLIIEQGCTVIEQGGKPNFLTKNDSLLLLLTATKVASFF